MNISLITPTGGRPEAFALCEKWIERQTVDIYEWIVVDDCLPRTEVTVSKRRVISPQKIWQPGMNTQASNMLLAIDRVSPRADAVIVIEDDDYYRPALLQTLASKIEEGYDIVGEGAALYYNLPERQWNRYRNQSHSGLCQSMFRRELLRELREAVIISTEVPRTVHASPWFIDFGFWDLARRTRKSFMFPEANLTIGLKGLPGRGGIGSGHVREKGWTDDSDLSFLKSILKKDFDHYERFTYAREQ